MTTAYLIYCYGQDGLVRSGAHARCADDNEALAVAWHAMLPDDSRGEIWQGQRRILLILGAGESADPIMSQAAWAPPAMWMEEQNADLPIPPT